MTILPLPDQARALPVGGEHAVPGDHAAAGDHAVGGLPDPIGELRIGDFITFLAVRRCSSITGAARELQVSPSQVSKAVGRLERHFRVRLLARGGRGITLSDHGQRLATHLEQMVGVLRQLRAAPDPRPLLTVAAPSFLSALFLPILAEALPRQRVRGLELPPALVRAYAAENFFDLTLTVGRGRLPSTWVCDHVGDVHKSLFAAPATARRLGPGPVAPDRLRDTPFVNPVYNVSGQFIQADDDCPLHFGERRAGHEVQTLFLALELASRTDHLVFGPTIAALRYLEHGTLVEIPVQGWSVTEPLFVCCNGERVLASAQKAIVAALRVELARLDALVLAVRPAPGA